LVLGHLLLGARDRILPARDIVHVNFVNVGLVLRQVFLGAGLQAVGTILLIEMQWVISGDVARPRRPHLVLRGVARLLHRRLHHDLPAVVIALPDLIALISTCVHLIVSSNLLIDAILKLAGLINSIIHLLLLQVIVSATGTISCEAAAARGLTLSIRVRVLTRGRLLSQEYLLRVIFKEVHACVCAAASLLEAGQILGLIYKLVMIVAAGGRATVAS
jgi:hypothetical protein